MCSECLSTPCHPRCPNADEPKPIFDCELCDDGIRPGEEFVEIECKKYHLECLDVEEVLNAMGVDTEVCLGDGWL